MEIHHAHHHDHPQHKEKLWKHYALEFFMLFLAVSLGFFVENYREQTVESHREKELAQSLYEELHDDSIVVANKVSIRLEKENDLDYLSNYFRDSSLTTLPRKFYPAYTTSTYLINTYAFEPKDGILSQLKSSGSLRYFKSVALQKLLGDLDVSINNIRTRNEQEYQFFANPVKPFMLEHYDFRWVNELRKKDPNALILNLINQYRAGNEIIPGELLNVSTLKRDEASNMILFYKQMLVSTRTLQLNNYMVTNREILEELRRTYKLSSE